MICYYCCYYCYCYYYFYFYPDVDGFTCETIKYLNMLHSNVLFHNMHNTLKLRYNSIHELNSLKQLSDSYLHSEPNSGDNSPGNCITILVAISLPLSTYKLTSSYY